MQRKCFFFFATTLSKCFFFFDEYMRCSIFLFATSQRMQSHQCPWQDFVLSSLLEWRHNWLKSLWQTGPRRPICSPFRHYRAISLWGLPLEEISSQWGLQWHFIEIMHLILSRLSGIMLFRLDPSRLELINQGNSPADTACRASALVPRLRMHEMLQFELHVVQKIDRKCSLWRPRSLPLDAVSSRKFVVKKAGAPLHKRP